MKKIIWTASLILAFVAVLSLCGCNKAVTKIKDTAKEPVTEIKNKVKDFFSDAEDIVPSESNFIGGIDLTGEIKAATYYPDEGTAIKMLSIESLSFNYLNDENNASLTIIPSDENMIEVYCPSDLEDYGFEVAFEGERAIISTDVLKLFNAKEFAIIVYANIFSIDIDGGIDFSYDGFSGENLDIDIKGRTEAKLNDLSVTALTVKVSGSAEFDLKGAADHFTADISGASEIDAKELIAKNAKFGITGAGEIEISCTDTLNVDAAGAGEIEYYGSPEINRIKTGALEIKQKSENAYTK